MPILNCSEVHWCNSAIIFKILFQQLLILAEFFDSFQVAEWMGRREAWSAEKSSNSRTKSTQWEFRKRNIDGNLESKSVHIANDKSTEMKSK